MKQLSINAKKVSAVLLAFVMAALLWTVPLQKVKAADTKYWIKVNKQANVATAYQLKNGKYKPIRAMLISCGGGNTPSGTYYTPAKYRWKTLMGPSYGQYSTRIYGGVLFHSVWYYSHSKASQSTKEFNKLGTTASHGCVRLSVADAKWIYDKCPLGTKVTVYSSSNPGPLGKPKAIKVSTSRRMYWDPTDPDKNNPYRKQIKAKISISSKKPAAVEYGEKYSIKSKVKAYDTIIMTDLTDKIKYSVKKYNSSKKKYEKKKFSTKSIGTYKITYTVKGTYSSTKKTWKVKVVDTGKPTIKNAKNRTVSIGTKNAVFSVKAGLSSGKSLTSKMLVYIKKPGEKKYKKYSYKNAKKYVFSKAGVYYVKYKASNTKKPYKSRTKTTKVTVLKNAVLTVDDTMLSINAGDDKATAVSKIQAAVTVTDNGTAISGGKTTVVCPETKDLVSGDVFDATISYRGKNKKTVKTIVTVEVQ